MQLSRELADQLSLLLKSRGGNCEHAPRRVTLKSGQDLDRVYVIEAMSVRKMAGSAEFGMR